MSDPRALPVLDLMARLTERRIASMVFPFNKHSSLKYINLIFINRGSGLLSKLGRLCPASLRGRVG